MSEAVNAMSEAVMKSNNIPIKHAMPQINLARNETWLSNLHHHQYMLDHTVIIMQLKTIENWWNFAFQVY